MAGKLFRRAELEATLAAYREHFAGAVVDRLSMSAASFKIKRISRRDY